MNPANQAMILQLMSSSLLYFALLAVALAIIFATAKKSNKKN